jgi:hypothetical protein
MSTDQQLHVARPLADLASADIDPTAPTPHPPCPCEST